MPRINHSAIAIWGFAALVVCGCQREAVTNQTNLVSKAKNTTSVPATVNPNQQTAGVDKSPSRNVSQSEQSRKMSDVVAETASQEATQSQQLKPKHVEPATVLQMAQALNLASFPKIRGAKNAYVFDSGLHYETSADLNTSIAAISDEFAKRGFAETEALPMSITFLVLKLEDLPMSINLTSVPSDDRTHVTIYKHDGVDTSMVPMLNNSSQIDERSNQVYYHVPLEIQKAHQMLRSKVESREIPIARAMFSTGVAKIFAKNGLEFVATVREVQSEEFEYPESEKPQQVTSVAIYRRGNVGFDDLPVPSEFESVHQDYARVFGSAKYIATSTVKDAAKLIRKRFAKAGWKIAEPIRQPISDIEHLFVKNGTMVQVRATQFNGNRTHVDYILAMLPFDIPSDIDAKSMRVDSAAPHMFYSTKAELADLQEYYVEALPELGWVADATNQVESDGRFAQLYHGSYHQPVILDIQKQQDQIVWVEFRPVNANEIAGLFNTKETKEVADQGTEEPPVAVNAGENALESMEEVEALARSQMEKALQSIPEEAAAEFKEVMEQQLGSMFNDSKSAENISTIQHEDESTGNRKERVPEDRIAAEDFPVPDSAERVKREFEMISFNVAELSKTAKYLNEKLVGYGWKPRGEQMIEPDYAFMKYQKGVGTIDVSLMLDERRNPPVRVIAQGDGIWFPDSEEFEDERVAFDVEMEGEGFSEDSSFEMPQEEFEGLPLPAGSESSVRSGSRFRTDLTTSVESDLPTVHNHFLNSAPNTEWKVTSKKLETETSQISMTGQRGELNIELTKYDGEIEIKLAFRDPKLAREMGMVPPEGKARLILANVSKSETSITINGKVYRLAAEQGARNPKDGIQVDVLPGKYNFSISGSGREEQSDKLNVVAGGAWGLLVLPEVGHMAEQMY